MAETVLQETSNPEKTFTQDEVDRIVGDRLRREREKYADYDSVKEKAAQYDSIMEEKKSEIQRATERADALEAELATMKKNASIREIRERVSKSTGVPAEFLVGETEEDCTAFAQALGEWKKPSNYPNVKDAGEADVTNGKVSTRQQFAEWFNNL